MKGNIACLVRLLGGHMLVTHESAGSIPVQGAYEEVGYRAGIGASTYRVCSTDNDDRSSS